MTATLSEQLFQAVLAGNQREAQRLLDAGAPTGATCPCGCGKGLLVAATIAGSTPLLRTLLERGADPNALAKNGGTPLMEAASWNRPEITELLLEAGATVGVVAPEGRTALGDAIYNGRALNIAHLIEAGAPVDTKAQNGHTALDWASTNGDQPLVSLLLARGADVEAVSLGGRRPLMSAAAGGHLGIVELLLAHGATVDARDARGVTALLHAATRGGTSKTALARRLIEAGADPNLSDDRNAAPLLEAAGHGDADLVTLLLERGAHPDARRSGGRSPLIHATAFGRKSIVRLLARRFPQLVNDTDRAGRTALAFAAESGSINLIDLLAREGAAVDQADTRGATPLLLALAKGHLEAAERLLTRGADLNHRSKGLDAFGAAATRGKAALSWLLAQEGFEKPTAKRLGDVLVDAVSRGDTETVAFLLDLGADPSSTDRSGASAVEAAVSFGSYDDRYRQPRSAREDPVAQSILSLLAAGAEPRSRAGGPSLLVEAIQLRCPEVTRALIKAGAEVDPDPVPWLTPLAATVLRGRVVLAKMLLARGADPERKGTQGRSALDLARESKKPAMRRLFGL